MQQGWSGLTPSRLNVAPGICTNPHAASLQSPSVGMVQQEAGSTAVPALGKGQEALWAFETQGQADRVWKGSGH